MFRFFAYEAAVEVKAWLYIKKIEMDRIDVIVFILELILMKRQTYIARVCVQCRCFIKITVVIK